MLKCKCGDTLEDWRGARGHVQFTGDDEHGDKMTLPDDWKDLFTEVADDDEQDDDGELPSECRKCGDRERQEGSMVCGECSDEGDESDSTKESDSDQSEGSQGGRLRRALTEDVRALWGGDR